jgi:antitoxin HicB
MNSYPALVERDDNGSFLVTFPDVPGAVTYGDTEADALAHAVNALETMLAAMIADRQVIPEPSPVKRRQRAVALPPLSAAKIELYKAMHKTGLRKAELARRLGWHTPQVDRLLDLRHASRLEQLDQAFHAMGKRLVLEVRDAA